ncbi:hypothetical protein BH10PSE3_BH10PSE3_20700 [soil metagenome]
MNADLHSLLAKGVHWDDLAPGVSADPLRDWGDLPLHVSVFDHSLSAEEASAIPYMFFRQAADAGALREYLEGERRFEAFYAELAEKGGHVQLGWRRRHFMPATSGRLRRIVRDSLRERRLMDVVFEAAPVRVLGGHDRTDVLLPATQAAKEALTAAVLRHGLFVLPYRSAP